MSCIVDRCFTVWATREVIKETETEGDFVIPQEPVTSKREILNLNSELLIEVSRLLNLTLSWHELSSDSVI